MYRDFLFRECRNDPPGWHLTHGEGPSTGAMGRQAVLVAFTGEPGGPVYSRYLVRRLDGRKAVIPVSIACLALCKGRLTSCSCCLYTRQEAIGWETPNSLSSHRVPRGQKKKRRYVSSLTQLLSRTGRTPRHSTTCEWAARLPSGRRGSSAYGRARGDVTGCRPGAYKTRQCTEHYVAYLIRVGWNLPP